MTTIFLLKFVVAIIVVVGLSIVSEKATPRLAGIIAGCPTGTAISLFYFGFEISPEFASKSALYNMLGVISMLCFSYCYYLCSSKFFKNTRKKLKIILSSIISIICFLFCAFFVQKLNLNIFLNLIIPVFGITFFVFLFREIPDTIIEKKVDLSFKTLLLRAFFAALTILLVTEIAKFLSPAWAGALSSFPTTLLPLIIIIHFSYEDKNIYTIIKNVPLGAYSLVLYSCLVSFLYPLYGVYLGTLLSFVISILYLVLQSKLLNKLNIKNNYYLFSS